MCANIPISVNLNIFKNSVVDAIVSTTLFLKMFIASTTLFLKMFRLTLMGMFAHMPDSTIASTLPSYTLSTCPPLIQPLHSAAHTELTRLVCTSAHACRPGQPQSNNPKATHSYDLVYTCTWRTGVCSMPQHALLALAPARGGGIHRG
jgi:hypothetical protein